MMNEWLVFPTLNNRMVTVRLSSIDAIYWTPEIDPFDKRNGWIVRYSNSRVPVELDVAIGLMDALDIPKAIQEALQLAVRSLANQQITPETTEGETK